MPGVGGSARLTLLAAAALVAASCAARLPPRPSGAPASSADAAAIFERATAHCTGLRTMTMELGSPAMGKEMCDYLLSYSPLHNIRHEGTFPPILNIVGENDPRCTPGHIYKWVAELQSLGDPKRLVILRVMEGAGHGTSNRDDLAESLADQLAFAWAMT